MGLLKTLLLIGLMFTPLAPVVIGYMLVKYGIKFIVWDVKLMFNAAFLLFIGIPEIILWAVFYLFLYQVVLKGIFGAGKFSAHWLEWIFGNFTEGIEVVENNAERAGEMMIFWSAIIVFLFPISLDTFLNPSFALIETLITLAAWIFLPLILGSVVLNKIKGGSLTETKQRVKQNVGQAANQPPQNAKRGAQGVYNKVGQGAEAAAGAVEKQHRVDEAAEGIQWLPGNVMKVLSNLLDLLHIKDKAAEKAAKTAERQGAKKFAQSAAGTASKLEYTSALPYMIAGLAIALIVLSVQMIALGGLFIGFVQFWLPMVVGPFMGVLGLGNAYATYLGGEAANSEIGVAAASGNLVPPEISRTAAEAGARMGCMLEGPQCLREWRLNNTVRPGSEARGERYELQIEQFGLGSGDSIDVAYKEANYALPINFLVSNTRNGLKGIPARNVSYKITVRDFDTKYCTTGWKPISSFGEDGRDAILPGLGVSPTDSMEKLNLGNCELLQPSLGVDRVMELQVKYQYSSQATLYVDAMSRQYRREEGIEPSFKKSETANTPVQSYINVKEPITFYETESGERKVVPFSARFGFQTPSTDVKYKVKPESIKIVDSSLTTDTSTCPGIQSESRENYYRISDNAETRIELRQNNSFFNSQAEPAPLRCTMALTQGAKNRISPTGEELVMRIDGNYTVVKEDRLTGFDVRNTLCTRYNCPLVVTEEYANDSQYNLYSECASGNSVDARGGCSIRVPGSGNEMNWRLPNVAKRNGEPVVVEQGSVARELGSFLNDQATDAPINLRFGEKEAAKTQEVSNMISGSDPVPYGVPTSEEITRQAARSNGVIFYESERNPGNVKIAQLDAAICEQQKVSSGSVKEALRDYMAEWKESSRGDRDLLQIVVEKRDCQDSISEFIVDSASCGINQYVNIIDASLQFYNPTDSVDSDTFDEQACQGVAERVRECSGVLVEGRRDLRCYGGQFGQQ